MKNIKDKIIGMTMGIRFSRTFRIPDIAGEMVDYILNDSKSPFDAKFFPKYNETSTKTKTLFNENGENLKITSDDIIISIKVDKNFDEKFKFFKEKIVDFFYCFFDAFSIESISRIGVVFYCNIEHPVKLNESIANITNNSVNKIQSLNLFFSEKKQTQEGLIKKGVKDYINIIYSIVKEKNEDDLEFNLDYQKNFIPVALKLKETKLDNHLDKAFEELNEAYEKWIKTYDSQQE